MTPVQDKAAEALRYFIYMRRDEVYNPRNYWALVDDAPDWLTTLVCEAHGGELPNDWRYENVRALLEGIAVGSESGDLCDSLVDVYNSDRAQWLAQNVGRGDYCDRAAQDLGSPSDIWEHLALGQYLAISEMHVSILTSLESLIQEGV